MKFKFCFLLKYFFILNNLLLASNNFVDQFNLAVDLYKNGKINDAIKTLENLESQNQLNIEQKYYLYYQLGSLYCHNRDFEKCEQKLKKGLKFYNNKDLKLENNLILAYKNLPKSSQNQNEQSKNDNQKNKNKNDPKNQNENQSQKLQMQLDNIKYSQKQIFNKVFDKNIKNIKTQFNKDW